MDPRDHVVAVLLCERVLTEVDGSTSVVRMIDQVTEMSDPVAPDDAPFAVQATLFIALRSFGQNSTHELRTRLLKDGRIARPGDRVIQVQLDAERAGANVQIALLTPLPGVGSYVFEVLLDGVVVGRAPLTLLRKPMPTELAGLLPSSSTP
jgi:hypothetical protein